MNKLIVASLFVCALSSANVMSKEQDDTVKLRQNENGINFQGIGQDKGKKNH